VVRGSPASLIGLRVGDFIVALNGKPVYLPGELVSRVRAQEIGGRFELEIYRRGDRLTARGVLGRLTGNLCQPARPSEDPPPPPRQQESSR
jgi:S1-C subfamily serine protease